jgi:hypothetical protein
MTTKSWIEIDAEIARLMDQVSEGKVTFQSINEIDQLIQDREALRQERSNNGERLHHAQG